MKPITLTIAVVALASFGSAQTLRSVVEAGNKSVHKHMMKKDVAGFAKAVKSQITKDFKYIEGGRTMNFDEMVAQMKMGFDMMSKVNSVSTKIISIKEKGNTAVVMSRHNMNTTMVGPDKKSHSLIMIGTSKDSYVKVKGKWLLSVMDWKNDSMKMDGVEVDPMTMQPIKK